MSYQKGQNENHGFLPRRTRPSTAGSAAATCHARQRSLFTRSRGREWGHEAHQLGHQRCGQRRGERQNSSVSIQTPVEMTSPDRTSPSSLSALEAHTPESRLAGSWYLSTAAPSHSPGKLPKSKKGPRVQRRPKRNPQPVR